MYLFIYAFPPLFQWQFQTEIKVILRKKEECLLGAEYGSKCFRLLIHFSLTLGARHYCYYPHFILENVDAKRD